MSPEERTDLTLQQGARLKLREHRLPGADEGRYLEEAIVAFDPRVDAERTMAGIDETLRVVCEDIAAGWFDRAPEPVDVLLEELPVTLLGWLLPAGASDYGP